MGPALGRGHGAATGTRVVLRRPWEVEASSDGPPPEQRSWDIVGWKSSGRAVDEVAPRIEAGVGDPAPVDARPQSG